MLLREPAAPLPVIALEYANPTTVPRRRRWLRAAQWALGLAALDLIFALLLIWMVDTETVLVTGSVLLACGAVLLVASLRLRLLPGTLLGVAHCSLPLLFTMLVNLYRWGPQSATLPFLVMGGTYLFCVALPVSMLVFRRTRALDAAMA